MIFIFTIIKVLIRRPIFIQQPIKYLIIFSVLFLTACTSQNGRYQQQYDSTPHRKPSAHELINAIPHFEKKSRGGNKNYVVNDIHYHVLASAEHYNKIGIASYYGNKFHGHLTSNGEIYNMYSMSAAHKSLPLPSFVKVTNLHNNKSVIVRVNDRGPFHKDRLIDLSYSAAYQLDMLKTGTAKVRVTAITPHYSTMTKAISLPKNRSNKPTPPAYSILKKITAPKETYSIQVFVTKNRAKAMNAASALKALFQIPVTYLAKNGLFRVQMGPLNNQLKIDQLLIDLKESGYPTAFRRKIEP